MALQSTYEESGPPFDHKIAQIASIFVLRQAMELRFERLIAVYPNDRKGNPPSPNRWNACIIFTNLTGQGDYSLNGARDKPIGT